MNKTATLALLVGALLYAGALFAQTPYFHWYQLNEGSGSVVANTATQSGMGSIAAQGVFTNGTGVATPTWASPGGLGDDCVNLNSPTAFLDSGLDPDIHLNSSDFTVELLVNFNGASQAGNFLFAMCTSSAIEVAILVTGSNRISLQVGTTVQATGSTILSDGNWHHVALVYDRTAQTATGYVDGNTEFSAGSQNYTFSASSKVVYFNGRTTSANGRYTGLADELKLDNTARSTSAFVMPNPGSGGGGGGGDDGDDGGCVASTRQGLPWIAGLLLVLLATVRLDKKRNA